MYRHALELALKDAYVWTEMTISQETTETRTKSVDDVRVEIQGHTLRPLLDKLQQRFGSINPHTTPIKPQGLKEAVDPAIVALDALDEDGQRLRYPYLTGGRGRSWSPERQAPSRNLVAQVSGVTEAALDHLLDVMGPWFTDSLDEAIESAWLAQLWEAERQALRLESLAPRVTQDWSMHGDPALLEDLKAELSAELLVTETDDLVS